MPTSSTFSGSIKRVSNIYISGLDFYQDVHEDIYVFGRLVKAGDAIPILVGAH